MGSAADIYAKVIPYLFPDFRGLLERVKEMIRHPAQRCPFGFLSAYRSHRRKFFGRNRIRLHCIRIL